MAEDILVNRRFEGGRKLLNDLYRRGVQVTAAGWLVENEGDLWHLYVVSDWSGFPRLTDAYRLVHDCLRPLANYPLRIGDVKLVRPSELAGGLLEMWTQNVVADLDRPAGRGVVRYESDDLYRTGYDQCWLYPSVGRMSPKQVMWLVANILIGQQEGSAGDAQRLAVVERGPLSENLQPTGLRLDPDTRRLVIDVRNPDSGRVEAIPADEISDIYVR